MTVDALIAHLQRINSGSVNNRDVVVVHARAITKRQPPEGLDLHKGSSVRKVIGHAVTSDRVYLLTEATSK